MVKTEFNSKTAKKKRNFCAQQSKFKLLIFEKDNTKHVLFSFLSEDRKFPDADIKKKMLTRANKKFDIKKAFFYKGNGSHRELDAGFTTKKPLVKLVVYDLADNRKSFTSLPNEDYLVDRMNKRNWKPLFQAMNERVLLEVYNGIYNSAVFYDQDDKEIFRITP